MLLSQSSSYEIIRFFYKTFWKFLVGMEKEYCLKKSSMNERKSAALANKRLQIYSRHSADKRGKVSMDVFL